MSTQSNTRPVPEAAVNMVGFALLEAGTGLRPFIPSWFNVWEAQLHKQAIRASGHQRWLFKRFGVEPSVSPGESMRRANYREMLNGLNEACRQSFASIERKKAVRIQRERTALIYFDSWGETSLFEGVNSWRDSLSIDMLPKAIARDYGVKEFSCKLRGERSGFLMGLRVAMDRLNSGGVDTVLLCGQYRSFPVLVMSQAAQAKPRYGRRSAATCSSSISVERVGCLILRKEPQQGIALHLSDYFLLPDTQPAAAQLLAQRWDEHSGGNTAALFGGTSASAEQEVTERLALAQMARPLAYRSLCADYGDSGCLNPTLALQHLLQSARRQEPQGERHALVSAADGQGGIWLMECWLHRGERQ